MFGARLLALAAPAGFSALAASLLAVDAVGAVELCWAVACVVLAYGPSGWVAPGRWSRRAAEGCVLPAAYALVMIGDPTMRRMAVPMLLVLASWAATAAALARTRSSHRPLLVACLAAAVRAAVGMGLSGQPTGAVLLALGSAALLGWGFGRVLPRGPAAVGGLLVGALPLQHWPLGTLVVAVGIVAAARMRRFRERELPLGTGWLPAAAALALVSAGVAPWGGIPLGLALPGWGWWGAAALFVVLVLSTRLAPGLAGPLWLAATLALGPLQPAPPDVAGFTLASGTTEAVLPAGDGRPYALELALANAAGIADETPVATLTVGDQATTLRAGVDAAEWAHERPDVSTRVGHSLPATPIWRPTGLGRDAFWGVAGRSVLQVPPGTTPVLARALPESVSLTVVTAGPCRPTPPRRWPLVTWILAAAAVVVALQLATRTWSGVAAAVPWTLIIGLGAVARMAVEPLHLLGERHGVDLLLAAVLAAWLLAARGWLGRGRVLLAAAVPLVLIALATPRLTPPMYGDEPFHLVVLDSLAHDWDLDLSNNLDLEHHPYNRIYVTGDIFLHSPALAFLLLPGYALMGRTGALFLLALAGAVLVALVVRRAEDLGVSKSRLRLLVTVMVLTYPLATFSSQIWVEVLGALAAAGGLVLLTVRPDRRWAIAAVAALVTAVKTRLALVTFPLAIVAWWPRRGSARERRRALLVIGAAVAAGLSVGWIFLGHPLGYRRLIHFVPRHLDRAVSVVSGFAFDAAGGLAFTAPLLLLAVLCAPLLWRRGGAGERLVLLGLATTVAALLPTLEWYGGGAPPARYLVPALPALALAGALLLASPRPWRPLARVLLPPALASWWVLVTRPHLSINPGDGGYWLADALSRRFQLAGRNFFPSFLRPDDATVVVPAVLLIATVALVLLSRWRGGVARSVARGTVGIWLVAAAALVWGMHARTDRIVELEDPQVARLGGRPEPPEGTFSRFTHRNGWRVADGEGVAVPLNLAAGAAITLEGWVEGEARGDGVLQASWDDGEVQQVPLARATAQGLPLPAPPGAGRYRLRLLFRAPTGGEAVLDRLVARP